MTVYYCVFKIENENAGVWLQNWWRKSTQTEWVFVERYLNLIDVLFLVCIHTTTLTQKVFAIHCQNMYYLHVQ